MYYNWFYSPLGSVLSILWLVVVIYTLYRIWAKDSHSETNKLLWTLLVLFLPVIGVILYLLVGRKPGFTSGL